MSFFSVPRGHVDSPWISIKPLLHTPPARNSLSPPPSPPEAENATARRLLEIIDKRQTGFVDLDMLLEVLRRMAAFVSFFVRAQRSGLKFHVRGG